MAKKSRMIIVVAVALSSLLPARAVAFIELNAFYFSESETTATTSTASRMFIDAAIGFRIDKKGQYLVGWGYSTHSQTDAGTATTTYTSTQMGPRFLWFIDKDKIWSLGLAYYLVTQASYSDGTGNAETWKGSALHVDAGYNLPFSENLSMGLRLNYSSASYAEKLIGSDDYSTIAYVKTFIYPSICVVYTF